MDSGIKIAFEDNDKYPLLMYTDVSLSAISFSNNIRRLFEIPIFSVYNYDPRLKIAIYYEDIRHAPNEEQLIIASTLSPEITLNLPNNIKDFRIIFEFSHLDKPDISTTKIKSNTYKLEDFDSIIDDIYYKGNLLTNGLAPIRTQHIITNGLGLSEIIDRVDFDVFALVPKSYYAFSGATQFFDYVSCIFKDKLNTISEIKLFGSVFDDLVINTMKNYGVKCDALQNDYIRMNLLINRNILSNMHEIWASKGTAKGLYGALKVFANVHPGDQSDQTADGWFLTNVDGGATYDVFDHDILLWADALPAETENAGDIIFAVDSQEINVATSQNSSFGINLSYFIDPWGSKNYFRNFNAASAISINYAYGQQLLDTLGYIATNFAPANVKIYYFWKNINNESVQLFTS